MLLWSGEATWGRACACCGAGSSGNRAALQARWEPLCPGGRGLGSTRRACCASLQPGRPARPAVLPVPPPLELGRGREQAERWPDTVDPRRVPEPQGQRGLRLVVRGPWVCLAGHRGMASVKGVEPEGLGVKPSLIVTWGVSVAGARTRGLKAPSPRAGHLRVPCAPSYSACCLRGPAGAVVASVLPRCVLSASEA